MKNSEAMCRILLVTPAKRTQFTQISWHCTTWRRAANNYYWTIGTNQHQTFTQTELHHCKHVIDFASVKEENTSWCKRVNDVSGKSKGSTFQSRKSPSATQFQGTKHFPQGQKGYLGIPVNLDEGEQQETVISPEVARVDDIMRVSWQYVAQLCSGNWLICC